MVRSGKPLQPLLKQIYSWALQLCEPISHFSLSPHTLFYSSSWFYSLSQTFCSRQQNVPNWYITEWKSLGLAEAKGTISIFRPLSFSLQLYFWLRVLACCIISYYRQLPSMQLEKVATSSSSLRCPEYLLSWIQHNILERMLIGHKFTPEAMTMIGIWDLILSCSLSQILREQNQSKLKYMEWRKGDVMVVVGAPPRTASPGHCTSSPGAVNVDW